MFGVDGLKSFIIQDDKKVLFGTEQLTRTDNKITLVNINFSFSACKNLTKNELDNLSDKARNFFKFVQSFGNKLKLPDFLNLWVVEDRIQDLDSVTRCIFRIYFCNNLFNPDKNSKIQNKKKTIEILLNELSFLDDQQQNKKIINEYANKHDIAVR